MLFENFKQIVLAKIKDYLPPEYRDAEIIPMKSYKNNGVELEGIGIRCKGKNIAPLIYLDPFYCQFLCDKDLDAALKHIVEVYMNNKDTLDFPISNILSYENVKDKVFVVLINKERNEEHLKEIPHEIREDIALTYRIRIETPDGSNGNILVQNKHLEFWGISEEELGKDAWNNMRKKFKPVLMPFGREMLILSNEGMSYGASYMFDDVVLEEIAEKNETDLIVIPSSVHEVLILKKVGDMNFASMIDMIKDINGTKLEQEDILSDDLFLYERGSHVTKRVNIDAQKQGMQIMM